MRRVKFPYYRNAHSCTVKSNGLPIYIDPDHLNLAGARLLAPILDPLL